MGVLRFNAFLGEAPVLNPTQLDITQSQTCQDAWLLNGTLSPINNVTTAAWNGNYPAGGALTSLYRYYPYVTHPTDSHLIAQSSDANFAESPISNDPYDRLFMTQGGGLYVTDSSSVTTVSGNLASVTWRSAGISTPAAPTLSVYGTTTDPNALAETRYYITSLVDNYGNEGPTSLPSAGLDVRPGETAQLFWNYTVSSGYFGTPNALVPGKNCVRVYRSATGTSGSGFFHVGDFFTWSATASPPVVDGTATSDLGFVPPGLQWGQPPTGITGLISLPGGALAGFVKNTVYFSEPGYPHAWPPLYAKSVNSDIVGLAAINNAVAVLTKGQPFIFQGVDPASMTPTKVDGGHACVAKRSVVDFGEFVIYAGPRGLVKVSSTGFELITGSLYSPSQWKALIPSTISAYRWDDQYIMFYSDDGKSDKCVVIDPNSPASGVARYSFRSSVGDPGVTPIAYQTAGYYDPRASQLFLGQVYKEGPGSLYPNTISTSIKSWNAGSPTPYAWKSKKQETPYPTSFGCAQVIADAYPVTLTYYADDTQRDVVTIRNNRSVRIRAGKRARFHEIAVQGTGTIMAVNLANSPTDLKQV